MVLNRLCLVLLLLMGLVGCTIRLPFAARALERPLPTIGPVQQVSGSSNDLIFNIHSNTNCVEIGETVTLTVSILNQSTESVTITGKLPFDIVLIPANWIRSQEAEPTQRWSESPQYPIDVDPILAPGESRTYQWKWQAHAIYGQAGIHGIKARFTPGGIFYPDGSSIISNGPEIWVGVHTMPYGEVAGGGIECKNMRRP